MRSIKRLRREDPARTGPHRNFSNVLRSDSVQSHDSGDTKGPQGSKQADATDPVSLAYRVIEKYITNGSQRSENSAGQPYTSRSLTDSLQELIDRVVRFQAEIAPAMIAAVVSAVRMDSPSFTQPSNEGRGSSAPSSANLNIEVRSTSPIQVSVDLKNGKYRSLLTHGLKSVEKESPILTDVSFVIATGGTPLVRIVVPDCCPAGFYSGVIVAGTTGELCGTIAVKVLV